MIELTKIGNGTNCQYRIYHKAGSFVGDFILGDDGYYIYWPAPRLNAIPSYFLRVIADKLDELNEEWDAIIQADQNI